MASWQRRTRSQVPNGEFRFSGYLEPEEIRAVINAVPSVSRHTERDQLLFELLWQSGSRVSEALTLAPERIGMTSVVLVNLKQKKPLKDSNGKTVRDEKGKVVKVPDTDATKEVEISESLCTRLKGFCVSNNIMPGEWVFKGNRNPKVPLSRWYVWNIMTKASEVAMVFRFGKKNIRTGGRFKGAYPHSFRHSSAMFLLQETSDISLVKEQLGHSSIVTTQGYAFAKRPKIRKAIKNIKW